MAGALLLLAFAISGYGHTPSADASCAGLPPLPRALASAQIVFVGKVISTRQHATVAIVRVEDVWRGRVPKTAVVENDSQEDARLFHVGVTYLFVPEGVSRTSPYQDNACTATRSYSRALARYRPRNAHRP